MTKYLMMLAALLMGAVAANAEEAYSVSAKVTKVRGLNRGHVHVTVDLADGYKIGSRSRKYANAPTVIETGGFGFYTTEDFKPTTQPIITENVLGEKIQVFKGSVTWIAEIEIMGGMAPTVEVYLRGQVCNDEGCINIETTVQAPVLDGRAPDTVEVDELCDCCRWFADYYLLIIAAAGIALPITISLVLRNK